MCCLMYHVYILHYAHAYVNANRIMAPNYAGVKAPVNFVHFWEVAFRSCINDMMQQAP